jgi:hypothetical protein
MSSSAGSLNSVPEVSSTTRFELRDRVDQRSVDGGGGWLELVVLDGQDLLEGVDDHADGRVPVSTIPILLCSPISELTPRRVARS